MTKPKKRVGGVTPQPAPESRRPLGPHIKGYSLQESFEYAAFYLAAAVCETTEHDRMGNTVPCAQCTQHALGAVQSAYGPLCARTKAVMSGVKHPKLRAAELKELAQYPAELKTEPAY
jgi:hypothetical protein